MHDVDGAQRGIQAPGYCRGEPGYPSAHEARQAAERDAGEVVDAAGPGDRRTHLRIGHRREQAQHAGEGKSDQSTTRTSDANGLSHTQHRPCPDHHSQAHHNEIEEAQFTGQATRQLNRLLSLFFTHLYEHRELKSALSRTPRPLESALDVAITDAGASSERLLLISASVPKGPDHGGTGSRGCDGEGKPDLYELPEGHGVPFPA